MKFQIAVENVGKIQLTSDYWDCECVENYIHSKHIDECLRCGYRHDEQPDSHVVELAKYRQSIGLEGWL